MDQFKPKCGECVFFIERKRRINDYDPDSCHRGPEASETTARAIGCGEGRFIRAKIAERLDKPFGAKYAPEFCLSFEQATELLVKGGEQ